MITTFDSLHIGDRARITTLRGCNKAYRHRLMAMGLTAGTEFTLQRIAPLGDPIAIDVRGFTLCLRKAEAQALSLEKCDEA